MFTRLRTTWFAGSGALVLVLALSGAVLGASVLAGGSSRIAEAEFDPLEVDTSLTFEDLDGNGVDDDCQTDVVPDPEAAAAAEAAADLDGDGTVSASEAAQSGRVGGKNCNHGGYVSLVAQASCDVEETTEPVEVATPTDAAPTDTPVLEVAVDLEPVEPEPEVEAPDCATDEPEAEEAEAEEAEEAAAECVVVPAPAFDPTTMTGPGAFGAYVASVAASDAVGGKNCNHGGAVSDAVKAAKAAAQAAREAAKAERQAEREAAKADQAAAKADRAAAKAERGAKAKLAKANGKGRGQDR